MARSSLCSILIRTGLQRELSAAGVFSSFMLKKRVALGTRMVSRACANMAARFTWKPFLRSIRSIDGTAVDCRKYIKQWLRCCSSTPGSQGKISETESEQFRGRPPAYSRLVRSGIRNFCKTSGKPNEIPELFNQFLCLPEQYKIASVDSALYWLSYYDRTEAAFALKKLMEEHGIPKSYSTYSALAKLYSRSSHKADYKTMFEEMIKDGLTPTARHYVPFVEAFTQRGDLMGAFSCLEEMQRSGVVRERNIDVHTALVRACTGQDSQQLREKVLEIFREFRTYRDPLSNDTLEAIKMWFDSERSPRWITSWSSPSETFHCQVCEQKLETGEYSEEELQKLKYPLVSHLWQHRKAPSQVRVFTTSGNYVDNIISGYHKFPESIVRFIETSGRYDVVLDSLNVGFFAGPRFDPEKVQKVAHHFLKQNKKVLAVGSGPFKFPKRYRPGAQTRFGKALDFLIEHCGVFLLYESSYDDVYFLSAAMHCGPGTILVSSDMFADHIHNMDLVMRAQFKRWQQHYQWKMEGFDQDKPIFSNVKNFDTPAHVQTTGDTWHFPSSDGLRWLCARKATVVKNPEVVDF